MTKATAARRIHIAIIGAGHAGLCMGMRLRPACTIS